jgi:hypothetical protein
MAEAPQTSEQKFTNKLLEILESSKNSVTDENMNSPEIVDNTAIRPHIFQLFDYISSEFQTVV